MFPGLSAYSFSLVHCSGKCSDPVYIWSVIESAVIDGKPINIDLCYSVTLSAFCLNRICNQQVVDSSPITGSILNIEGFRFQFQVSRFRLKVSDLLSFVPPSPPHISYLCSFASLREIFFHSEIRILHLSLSHLVSRLSHANWDV